MNKANAGDGIPAELFQIPKDDAVKVLHSICQQIWKTHALPGKGRSDGLPGEGGKTLPGGALRQEPHCDDYWKDHNLDYMGLY